MAVTTLTEEQMKIRRQGVTGSEIAAVAGLSEWAGPMDVWRRKLGLEDGPDQNHHMERGVFLEGGLREWLAHRMGYEVRDVGTVVHPEYPFVIATPDGVAYDGEQLVAAVELKSPSWRSAHRWEDPIEKPDGIDPQYIPQVIWEMAVLGAPRADVGALVDGDLRVYSVPFNGKLFDLLLERAREFMTLIETKTPPPIDGTEASSEWLREQFPTHRDIPMLEADKKAEDIMFTLRGIMNEIKDLKQEKDEHTNKLKELIGEAPGMKSALGSVTWKRTKDREGWDTKKMAAFITDKHPELVKEFETIKPGPRVFRANWKKGK